MLERLEVENFKSYAGKQIIGPFHDFTCVIGPNGSGKSNLMDAISFVLGVRSAQLRSTQLKDLIYRPGVKADGQEQEDGEGSGADGSQSKTRSASVTAVVRDKDNKEFRFQRTVSASGTSEYKLNGKTTTYASYNSVLESLNILVRAKNFLVFQGDVEAVAQQSPRDLSKLIESISGSGDLAADYDRLKSVAERASESLTAAFNKRRGFNTEIKHFKEQKAEAARFDQLRAKRDQAVVHQLVWKLHHIQQGIEERQAKINGKNDTLRGLRAEQAEIEDKLRAARKEHTRAARDVSKQEKATKKREKDLEEARPSMTAAETKLRHTSNKIKATEGVLQQVSKDREPRASALKELEKDLQRARRAFEEHQDKVRKASQARGLTLSDEDLKTYRDLKAQAAKKAVNERQELRSLQRDIKDKQEALDDLRDKLEQAGASEERLRREEQTLDSRAETSESKLENIKKELARVKREQQEAAAERTRISQTQTELNEKLEECLNKLQQAQAERNESRKEALLRETVDGFQRSMPGRVIGRVMDLVKPTQRKYETAITVVLGRNIDSIVVDTQATAIACIQDMRNSRAGTATFLPLDTIQSKPIQDRLRSLSSRARLAIDLVQFDRSLEKAAHYVCGSTLVVDNIDVAKDICYNQGEEVKAVTEDGTIFHKAGLITGGAAASTGARRWDEGTVAGLERLQENLRSQLVELAKAKPRNSEDERMLAEIARLEADLGVTKDDLSATKSRLQGVRSELEVVQQQVTSLSSKAKNVQGELDALSTSAASVERVVRDAEKQIYSDFCRALGIRDIQEYENKALRQAQEEGEAELRFTTQISRLEHQIRFETEQLSDVDERLETLRKSLESDKRKLAGLQQEKQEIESSIANIESKLEGMRNTLKILEEDELAKGQAVESVKQSSGKSSSGFQKALKEISSWNDEIENFASERFTIYRRCKLEEIALPLTSGSVDDVPLEEGSGDGMDIDQADDGTQQVASARDYGIQVDFEDELDEDERENGSVELERELQANVQALIDDIQKMTPNLKAIDKLDDVEAKLSATDHEFDRIRKEAKNAKDAFAATKKKRYNLFNKAFQHISENIDKVYKELTKGKASLMGGVAYLSLEESDEPYLHGIKYHAMPPMKRFRDMDQLSGGEKTMAALALLFAIHSYHPSPFFVLDEVDAALDNTNVGRIANYVRSRSSEDFQFVVISLKNAFFEKSKALVGIWRDVDGGSSKTLTLDLEKY